MGDRRLLASRTLCALMVTDDKWCQSPLTTALLAVYYALRQGLWLDNYHSYSVMASSRADSNQEGGTKLFRHAVDNNGDRTMSIFVVSTLDVQ